MIEVIFQNRTYYLPENWSELNADQLYSYIEIAHTSENNEEVKLKLIQSWMKISLKRFVGGSYQTYKGVINNYLLTDIVDKLFPFVESFLEDTGFEKAIVPTISIPGIENRVFYGFTDRLENVTAEEFSTASHFYQNYIADSTDKENLYKFIATLYRPMRTDGIKLGHTDFNGDMRCPFNENNIAEYAPYIAKIHPYKLEAIKFNFERIMKWYGDLPEFHDVFHKGEQRKTDYVDWDNIIRSIAGDKLGTIDKVKRLPQFEVFRELKALEDELQTREAQIKETNSKYTNL